MRLIDDDILERTIARESSIHDVDEAAASEPLRSDVKKHDPMIQDSLVDIVYLVNGPIGREVVYRLMETNLPKALDLVAH